MPAITGTLLALGAVVIIGGLDASVGARLVFAPLYTVPIGLTAWHAGGRHGLAVALAASAAHIVSDLAWHAPDAATAWNALVWPAGFAALAGFAAAARDRRDAVTALEARLGELIHVEHSLARTDPLTSLCNRRAFIDALQQAEARSRRSGGALAVARLDVDGFGALNEIYSRADGDQLLRAIATSLSLTTRMGDLAARLENDEFSILLYGCAPADAQRVGTRLVAEVAELGRAYPESRVTASVGIACFAAPGPDPDTMMRLAGSALRRARENGGNAVLVQHAPAPNAGAV